MKVLNIAFYYFFDVPGDLKKHRAKIMSKMQADSLADLIYLTAFRNDKGAFDGGKYAFIPGNSQCILR